MAISSEIIIGNNLFDQIKSKKGVVVMDAALIELYGDKIDADLIAIPNKKTLKTLHFLLKALFEKKADKETTLIAVGGGNITDLAAFAASIYMRGIDLILVPTSLLAMVDAAIGGKTAIDTPLGKNLIGSLYHPKAIFIDLDTLKTLPEKEWINGLAEIWKMGLVYDASILQKKRDNPELIRHAINAKLAVMEQDPIDASIRRILNFGHTFGHVIEILGGVDHGQAVAFGCLMEAHLSMALGYLAKDEFKQIETIFPRPDLKNYDKCKFLEIICRDKKSKNGIPRFVLIDQIGHAIPFDAAYCREVSIGELEPTLKFYGL